MYEARSLMFPVAALFLCGWAIHATLRFRRFGSCELQLSRVPGEATHNQDVPVEQR